MDSSKESVQGANSHQENSPTALSAFDHDYGVDRVPTVTLYDGDKVNLIPMPTDDPNGNYPNSYSSRLNADMSTDPLNLPAWRTWAAIGSLCLCKSSHKKRSILN